MAVVKAGCGGGMDGLCCRMVIETKRVFDGCAFSDANTSLTLTADRQIPQSAEFVSARVAGAEFENYSISCGDGECCRVSGNIVTRFAVTYSDGGQLVTVNAFYRESKEALLRLPRADSLVPYAIEVKAQMSIRSGALVGGNAVTVVGCILQIVKVTAPVDILVPTYGYCKYPPCAGDVCRGIRADNIFPALETDGDIV